MAVISTGNHPKALWPGVAAWWGEKYAEHSVEYTQIFDVKSSSQNYEEDVQTSGFGLVPTKTEGGATQYDSHTQGYVSRYVHTEFGMGWIVTRAERDDNLYEGKAFDRTGDLAYSLRQTEENVGANVLNRAHTSGYTGGDGSILCVTTHSDFHGTWSNTLSSGADLSEASIESLAIQIMDALNPRGLKISLMPKRLIIPTALSFESTRVLKSLLQNDTANNAINALRVMGTVPEVAVNHYLTDSDAFFIKTSAPRGLCWYDRVGAEFSADSDFDTDNNKAKCYRRFSVGWTDPRGCYSNNGGA
jgi:hypothetical protein